jgi:site-specific recombinase XerD
VAAPWDANGPHSWPIDVGLLARDVLGSIRPEGLRCERYLLLAVIEWLTRRTSTLPSVKSYLGAFSYWVRATGLRRLDHHLLVRPALLTGYIDHLRSKNLAPRTINHHMAVVRSWYGWLHDHGLVGRSPYRWHEHHVDVDRRRLYHRNRIGHVRRALDGTAAEAAIAWAFTKATPVQGLSIVLMLCASLRRAEAVAIQRDDIWRQGDDWCLTVRGKGNKSRVMTLEGVVIEALERFHAEGHGPGRPPAAGPLLVNRDGRPVAYRTLQEWVERVGKVIGRPDLRPHELRRTYATRLRDNGAELEQVQDALGHASADTTRLLYDVGDRRTRVTTGLKSPATTSKG